MGRIRCCCLDDSSSESSSHSSSHSSSSSSSSSSSYSSSSSVLVECSFCGGHPNLIAPFASAGVMITESGWTSTFDYEKLVPTVGPVTATIGGMDISNFAAYLPFDLDVNGCPILPTTKQALSSVQNVTVTMSGFVQSAADLQIVATLRSQTSPQTFKVALGRIWSNATGGGNIFSEDAQEDASYAPYAERGDDNPGGFGEFDICEELLDGLLITKVLRVYRRLPYSPFTISGPMYTRTQTAQLLLVR